MPAESMLEWLQSELQAIEENKLYKSESLITSASGSEVTTADSQLLNFCANNYLGLANHPELVQAAQSGLATHGFGLASVRFICGTQDIHKQLEQKISGFFGTDDTILYNSCFDANTGLFETLLGSQDAIISDELNHASIIDGIRLCKAKRFVYKHADITDLEQKLQEAADARFRLVITDGVFSMQGDLAPLPEICDLVEKYDAILVVDDSHATGFLGPTGRGTPEYFGAQDRVDLITSTLGKAMGGASGGFTTGHQEIIDYLRQRSRPYLFSNTIAPPIVSASLRAFDLVDEQPELRTRLLENTAYFRQSMSTIGFTIIDGIHPIVPIMIGEERATMDLAKAVRSAGIYVVGFSFPVVPRGEARIRVQISAAHTRVHLDKAIDVFRETGTDLGII